MRCSLAITVYPGAGFACFLVSFLSFIPRLQFVLLLYFHLGSHRTTRPPNFPHTKFLSRSSSVIPFSSTSQPYPHLLLTYYIFPLRHCTTQLTTPPQHPYISPSNPTISMYLLLYHQNFCSLSPFLLPVAHIFFLLHLSSTLPPFPPPLPSLFPHFTNSCIRGRLLHFPSVVFLSQSLDLPC